MTISMLGDFFIKKDEVSSIIGTGIGTGARNTGALKIMEKL
jgi:hypothetical protein